MDPAPRIGIVRSIVSAVVTALFAVLLLLVGARWLTPTPLTGPLAEGGWTRRSRAAFVPAGFYNTEFDTSTRRSFSWSREQAQIDFPALRRGRAHLVTLTVRGIRPPQMAEAHVTIKVDDQVRLSGAVPNESSPLTFEIARAERTGAVVSIETAVPYRPGGSDPRALGIVVDDVSIQPVNGRFVPAARSLALVAAAVFFVSLALRLCGLAGALGFAVSTGFAAACVWLLLRDGAFLGVLPVRLAWLGLCALLWAGLVRLLRAKWPTIAGVPEWSIAAGLILVVSLIKLGVFVHPLAIVGDGIFQVHRAQVVHGGQYFFTSVTPKPFFEFPYPVALYVFALPFWQWYPTELDLLRLLRTIAIVADGLTGLMLYGAIRRQWDNRIAAFACAGLWPMARAPFEALSNANLTNLFGQSIFGAALAGIAWMAAASSASVAATVLLWALLVVAFLSHFGTVTVGIAMLGAVGLALIVSGAGHPRRVGVRALAMLIAALLGAWVVYYSHFTDVYRRTWAAVAARESDDASKMVASPAVKLERWWKGIGDDYGRPGVFVLIATLIGAAIVIRGSDRGLTPGAGRVLLAWLLAWIALTAIGIFTPLTLRANLAAAPAFIAFSAIAISALASRGGLFRYAAVVAGLLVAWDGWQIAVNGLRIN